MKIFLKNLIRKIHGFFTGYSFQRYIVTAVICVGLFVGVVFLMGEDALVNILGVIIGMVIGATLLNIVRAMLVNMEDENKVSSDDGMLSKIYDKSYLKTLLLGESKITCSPATCISTTSP